MSEPSQFSYGDVSQRNVVGISQRGLENVSVGSDINVIINQQIAQPTRITIDGEVTNLLEWLASQQGISPEIALKKAVVTAAYIQDITVGQGGKLLIKRTDNSVGEIVLK